MDAAVEMVMHFLERHHDWAGPIVAVLAFCESVVLVGLAVPATALMIMFGTLLGLGIIDPVPVVAGAVLALQLRLTLVGLVGDGLMASSPS
ncbi:membrane protein DedA with SNARE-associated domain [Azospirillum sp. OGB3]|uniref:hypothetical protein n=1 Tax=Azospirillum sp. OGB3 TaxID=2587012 RepID=UPI001606EE0F|nr:hypothetical protein [Azospirillum sp. OGB3]MBB3268487.1 membrane protein DedA with SNARE-associated domain [Azospirillum sp. OGB3]